jgi:hypothetical protein
MFACQIFSLRASCKKEEAKEVKPKGTLSFLMQLGGNKIRQGDELKINQMEPKSSIYEVE